VCASVGMWDYGKQFRRILAGKLVFFGESGQVNSRLNHGLLYGIEPGNTRFFIWYVLPAIFVNAAVLPGNNNLHK
jgi:hypothetical protein